MVAWTKRQAGVTTPSRRCRCCPPFARPRGSWDVFRGASGGWAGCCCARCAMMTGEEARRLTRISATRRTPRPGTLGPSRAEKTRSPPDVFVPDGVTTTAAPPRQRTASGSQRGGRSSPHGRVPQRRLVVNNRGIVRSRPPVSAQRAMPRRVTRPVIDRIAAAARRRGRIVVRSRPWLQHATRPSRSGLGGGSWGRVGLGSPSAPRS
jgi:hypothetical protein